MGRLHMTVLHGSKLEILGTVVVLREVIGLERGFVIELCDFRSFSIGIEVRSGVVRGIGSMGLRTRVGTGGVQFLWTFVLEVALGATVHAKAILLTVGLLFLGKFLKLVVGRRGEVD